MADVSGAYYAAGGRVGVAIPFASHRFAFTLAGDVLGTVHPFRLILEDRPVLWQTGAVAGAVQAGVSTFFSSASILVWKPRAHHVFPV